MTDEWMHIINNLVTGQERLSAAVKALQAHSEAKPGKVDPHDPLSPTHVARIAEVCAELHCLDEHTQAARKQFARFF